MASHRTSVSSGTKDDKSNKNKAKDDEVIRVKDSKSGDATKQVCPSDKIEKCNVCDKLVRDNDLGLQCEICESWFHINCQEITDDEYNFLILHKSLHWYCLICNKSVVDVIKMVATLKTKYEKLQESVDTIDKNVSSLTSRVTEISSGQLTIAMHKTLDDKIHSVVKNIDDKIEVFMNSVKAEVTCLTQDVKSLGNEVKVVKDPKPLWSALVSKEVDTKFEKVSSDVSKFQDVLNEAKKLADEEKDRETRSLNVIMYRVDELDSKEERIIADKSFCLELTKEVLKTDANESDFKSIIRLGKKETGKGPRPMLVQFRERVMKNKFMESLYRLKDADVKFKNISITHDFTPNERVECKSLVIEAKKKQDEEKGEYLWRVRGLPGQLKLIKIRKN